MSTSELETQVARFGQNESRVDKWVNGGPTETYKASDGTDVPTIRNINDQVAYMPVQFDTKLLSKADKLYVDTALSNLSTTANKFYPTLAEANYYSTTMAVNDVVTIGEEANKGLWYKATAEATTLTKSPYDPLAQAKADATSKANAAEANALAYADVGLLTTENNLLAIEDVDVMLGSVWTDGAFLRNTGAVNPFAGFSYSDYLDINPNTHQYLVFRQVVPSADASTCFYDKDKQFISAVMTYTISTNMLLAVPVNAQYVRFSTTTINASSFSVIAKSILRENISTNLVGKPDSLDITDVRRNPDESTGSLPKDLLISLEIKSTDHFVKSIVFQTNKKTGKLADLNLYERTPTGFKKVKKIADVFAATNGESLLDFSDLPVLVKRGQFLGMYLLPGVGFSDLRQRGRNADYPSYYLPNLGHVTDPQVIATSVNPVNDSFKLAHTLVYSTLDTSPVDEWAENFKTVLRDTKSELKKEIDSNVAFANRKPYVSVFHDNFKTINDKWLQPSNTWEVDLTNGTITPTVVGGSIWNSTSPVGVEQTNTLKLDLKYEANRRTATFRVSLETDTVLEVALTNESRSHPDGSRCFQIDAQNKTLNAYSIQGSALGTAPIDIPLTVGRDYVVEVSVDRLQETLSITDYITGERSALNYVNSWGGNQCQFYTLALKSGSPFTLREVDISIMRRPKVYIVGDSITAYEASAVTGWAYKLTEALNGSVVISARGNDAAHSIPDLFESEVKHIKPEILMWCHGHNGEKIQASRLDQVKALCDEYGIIMYVNRGTCKYRDEHIQDNNIIDTKNFKGVRFDIATARDSNPYIVEGDTALRADPTLYRDVSIHPNEAGNQKMWERFFIDMPEIFN